MIVEHHHSWTCLRCQQQTHLVTGLETSVLALRADKQGFIAAEKRALEQTCASEHAKVCVRLNRPLTRR